MEIIEQKVTGKTTADLCEDGIVANNYYVAVIDGSTSKTNRQISSRMSNGKYCMLAISEYISMMPPDINISEFCIGITKYIRNIYVSSNGIDLDSLRKDPTLRMTASSVIYSSYHHQVWMIGDCQCMVNGKIYLNPKPEEKIVAAKRADIIYRALQNGTTLDDIRKNDIGRKAILPLLKSGCLQQNISYSVIDGFDIPMSYVKIIDIDKEDSEIILASDGYPKLMSSLKESEEKLKELLTEDPLCIKENVATKGLANGQTSFDDRSYIRFKI